MGTEEDLSAALDTIRTMSLAWAGEAGLPDAHVAAITTGSFVIRSSSITCRCTLRSRSLSASFSRFCGAVSIISTPDDT